ncbi:unnamed protein product, partial [marine sediment metagenome]
CICNGQMYWLFGPHMNQPSSATVYYHLYRTPTGNAGDWEHVKTFSATPKSSHGKYRTKGCVGSLGNDLYVAVQNKVYKMGVVAPPVPPPPLEEDHRGANWIISTNTKVAGKHTNVGLFKVNPGVTAIVEAYNGAIYGTLEVHAADIDMGGTIIASGKGYGGGGAGGGGAGGYENWPGAKGSRAAGAGGPGTAGGKTGNSGAKGYYHGGGGGAGGQGGGLYGGPGGAGGRHDSPGNNGNKGGYAASQGQGDTSVDESLNMGSGGGGA